MNVIAALILIFISLVILFYNKKGKIWDPFSPSRIFPSIWIGSVGISLFKLTNLEEEWNGITWLCICLGLIGYFTGTLLAQSVGKTKGLTLKSAPLADRLKGRWGDFGFKMIISFLFIVSFSVLIFEFYMYGQIPLLSGRDVYVAKFGFAVNSFVHRIALLLVNVIVLSVLYISAKKIRNIMANKLVYSIILISFVSLILTAARLFIATVLMEAIIIRHYLVKFISKKKFIVITGLVVAFILIFFALLTGYMSGSDIFEAGVRLGIPEGKAWLLPLLPVYMSISMNFSCFNALTRIIPDLWHGYYYGWYLLYPIRVFLGFNERADSLLLDAGNIVPGFVTPTYMGAFYVDFGILGVVLGSVLMGFCTMYVYRKMTDRPTLFNVYLYSSIVWCLIFSVYSNLFTLFDFWFGIMIIWLINMFIQHPINRNNQKETPSE